MEKKIKGIAIYAVLKDFVGALTTPGCTLMAVEDRGEL